MTQHEGRKVQKLGKVNRRGDEHTRFTLPTNGVFVATTEIFLLHSPLRSSDPILPLKFATAYVGITLRQSQQAANAKDVPVRLGGFEKI